MPPKSPQMESDFALLRSGSWRHGAATADSVRTPVGLQAVARQAMERQLLGVRSGRRPPSTIEF